MKTFNVWAGPHAPCTLTVTPVGMLTIRNAEREVLVDRKQVESILVLNSLGALASEETFHVSMALRDEAAAFLFTATESELAWISRAIFGDGYKVLDAPEKSTLPFGCVNDG